MRERKGNENTSKEETEYEGELASER
jgi:hypothetical protein